MGSELASQLYQNCLHFLPCRVWIPAQARLLAGRRVNLGYIYTHPLSLIPDIFLGYKFYHTDKVIEWSPDGSKLAALSSDGRIVVWDAHTFETVAEYAGYRSILDFYAENP